MHRLAITFFVLFSAISAHASSIAVTSFTGGQLAHPSGDKLYGWFFDNNADIFVTNLGVFDADGDGLSIAHDVGIFRVSDHSLLLSNTVPAGTGATLLDGFRYVPVSPFFLPAAAYVIVMTMPDSNADGQFISNTTLTTAPQITWTGSAVAGSLSLVYPTVDASFFDIGMFGPNFQFDAGADTTSAPEPGSVLLLLGGGLTLAFLRRSRV